MQQPSPDSQPNLQEVIVANLRDALPAMLKPIHDDIQQLRGDVKQIQEELRHTRRLTARAWNNNTWASDSATFEIVPFPNLDDPTNNPHNLPPLNSIIVIRELEYHYMRAYVQGYYPDLLEVPAYRDECVKLILTAIGAYQHVRR
ncbi:hypothetical protein CCMSSC00406_0008079 [Pleurotus cornucopiae]|uniref:Uncharacterized protein n=1 Tax=Pleurotus cornucopiae TaxID=5321 RepID=A0ACB7IJM3_PLECO|nr:hypothetical protein CCMSSC00406_0008079 [Pleurotus cornucopiae]